MGVRLDLLGQVGLLLSIVLTSPVAYRIGSAAAQDSIVNSANANLRRGSDPSAQIDTVTSNQVQASVTPTPASLDIVKVGDRASAEPGDTVVYRLSIRNTGEVAINNLTITDVLPRGVLFLKDSLRASLTVGNSTVPATLTNINTSNRTVSFTFTSSLPPGGVLSVAYAASITPDAIRGSGRNSASAQGTNPTGGTISSGTASHLLRIRPGILSDCGTLIGRVFVDKNFDGEQQPGEPGVPDAVIYLSDGNRVTTDVNGLFSLANVLNGNHTGSLDLSSVPGYKLAPNRYRLERNSQSRLVRLEPGGLARMNFAVTPLDEEGQR